MLHESSTGVMQLPSAKAWSKGKLGSIHVRTGGPEQSEERNSTPENL